MNAFAFLSQCCPAQSSPFSTADVQMVPGTVTANSEHHESQEIPEACTGHSGVSCTDPQHNCKEGSKHACRD